MLHFLYIFFFFEFENKCSLLIYPCHNLISYLLGTIYSTVSLEVFGELLIFFSIYLYVGIEDYTSENVEVKIYTY